MIACSLAQFQVRSTLQDMIRKSVAKIKSSIPAGAADDVAAFLADQLSAANRNAAGNSGQAPGARTVMLMLSQPSAATVKAWAGLNQHRRFHSASRFRVSA